MDMKWTNYRVTCLYCVEDLAATGSMRETWTGRKCARFSADTLMLETGLRIGEALRLEWTDVTLKPIHGSRFGFLRVPEGKSKNARRVVPLTDRASAMLQDRKAERDAAAEAEAAADPDEKKPKSFAFVFASRDGEPYLGTSLNHLHRDAFAPKVDGIRVPIFAGDFVLHSLRHTMLTRLGESGVDAFTIMRIAGHSSIVVSQRYIHPTPEAVERAFERLQLSAKVTVIPPKRWLPATVSATVKRRAAVSR
jgi:integrase